MAGAHRDGKGKGECDGKRWYVVATTGTSDRALLWQRQDAPGARVSRVNHSEYAVARRLIAEGFEVLCPVEQKRRMRGMRKKRVIYTIEQPMLPGYLLIATAFMDAAIWHGVCSVPGVDSLLTGASLGAQIVPRDEPQWTMPLAFDHELVMSFVGKFLPSDPCYEVAVFDAKGVGFSQPKDGSEPRKVLLRKRSEPRKPCASERAAAVGLTMGAPVRVVSGPFAGHVGPLTAIDSRQQIGILLQLLGSSVPVQLKAEDVEPHLTA